MPPEGGGVRRMVQVPREGARITAGYGFLLQLGERVRLSMLPSVRPMIMLAACFSAAFLATFAGLRPRIARKRKGVAGIS